MLPCGLSYSVGNQDCLDTEPMFQCKVNNWMTDCDESLLERIPIEIGDTPTARAYLDADFTGSRVIRCLLQFSFRITPGECVRKGKIMIASHHIRISHGRQQRKKCTKKGDCNQRWDLWSTKGHYELCTLCRNEIAIFIRVPPSLLRFRWWTKERKSLRKKVNIDQKI